MPVLQAATNEADAVPVLNVSDTQSFYICSLSSRTITYKGQLSPEQVKRSHFRCFVCVYPWSSHVLRVVSRGESKQLLSNGTLGVYSPQVTLYGLDLAVDGMSPVPRALNIWVLFRRSGNAILLGSAAAGLHFTLGVGAFAILDQHVPVVVSIDWKVSFIMVAASSYSQQVASFSSELGSFITRLAGACIASTGQIDDNFVYYSTTA